MIFDLYRNEEKENFKLQILKREQENFFNNEYDENYYSSDEYEDEEEDEITNYTTKDLFQYFYTEINKLECNKNTNDEIKICLKKLKKITEIIKFNGQDSPEQFILLIHAIYVLYNPQIIKSQSGTNEYNEDGNMHMSMIYDYNIMATQLINKYDNYGIVDDFLKSDELDNYLKIFSGIFGGWDETLLFTILSKSEDAASIMLSKGLLDSILITIESIIKEIFNNIDQQNREITDYLVRAITILEKLVNSYNIDKSYINSIFDFTVQFLSPDYLNIQSGFLLKIIDCISSCIQKIEDLSRIDVNLYLQFLMELLDNKERRYQKSVLNFFNTISTPPLLFQWNKESILNILNHCLKWYKEENSYYLDTISMYFNFLSHAVSNQFDIFDILLEYSFEDVPFLEIIFSMFENESYKIKTFTIRLLLSFTIPQIWPKSIEFFLSKNIITNLFLFIESEFDEKFRKEIVKSLIQICSVDYLSFQSEIQMGLVKEIQSDIASDVLSRLENEEDEINEYITELTNKIKSIRIETDYQ